MNHLEQIIEIHESMENGQRKQAVEQMQDYLMYDFFADYANYLTTLYEDAETREQYIIDAASSYFRITNK
jgi:hypothetical protein